jgi:hypothetical protein
MEAVPQEDPPSYEDWKTFTLTYVEYPKGDYLAKTLAVLSLSPLVIVIMFLTFFAAKRDMHTMTYGIGTILNGILNYVLKHRYVSICSKRSRNNFLCDHATSRDTLAQSAHATICYVITQPPATL